ncbi:Hypothetical protein ORPV_836 [Orpheovirus IHUMI-LCC2]|uniref:Uncharacterized protein n=1 Tax=Orpheovirus IHUMI-LCC2 TaxID=2023057 RepID=A0A2I2L5G7_9VIRU|nr:Hypothetical protein ORPV_836 [Orpheovirus IHUMI-LCC2]SNW62740.1 Hypothetical protein ORPV_836 [Orpheovirus IHUMI-LCC2]
MNNWQNVRCPRCGSCNVKLIETITRNKQCGCETKTQICCVYKCCCCYCKFKKRVKPQPPCGCEQPKNQCPCNKCRPVNNWDCECNKQNDDCGCRKEDDCGCRKEEDCGCDRWNHPY